MKRSDGYTLLEVLVAAIILTIAISAAAALALATVSQEERNNQIARYLNFHEQAARLYQLGVEPSTITDILPPDPAIAGNQLTFSISSLAIPNLGTVQRAESTLEFSTDGESTRTSTLIVIRPSLR